MAANDRIVPAATAAAPYFDDYDEDKGFHRILFWAGGSVQARELTQLQTIMQKQIERFGRHIFQDGSMVIGGQISYDTATTLNLSSTYSNTDVDVTEFDQKTIIRANDSLIRASVLAVEEGDEDDPTSTLFIKYLTGDEFGADETIKVSNEQVFANVATTSFQSKTKIASISDGVFFISGTFVKTSAQTIFLDRFSITPSYKVGLELNIGVIDEGQDTSLLDPAQDSGNYQGRGARRLQYTLTLSKRSLDSEDDESFIELLRVESGLITKHVKYPVYSELEKMLAMRTYEESGDYTVDPFVIELKDHVDGLANSFTASLDPGIAYVKGFRFETIAPTNITFRRGRDTANIQNYDVYANYGNYVTIANVSSPGGVSTDSLFNTNDPQPLDVHCVPHASVLTANARVYGASKIGTCFARAVTYDGTTDVNDPEMYRYKAYLFSIDLTPITGRANVGSGFTLQLANTANSVQVQSLSPVANAYTGAILKITSGSANGFSAVVTEYNPTTRTVTLSKTVPASISVGTAIANANFTLNFNKADIESFIGGSTSKTSVANISTASKRGNVVNGDTIITDENFVSLIFPLPKAPVVAASQTDQSYAYRQSFTNRAFTSGVGSITVSAGEALVGSGVISSSLALENYIVIVTDDKGSSNFANGTILPLANSGFSIAVNSGTTATITTPYGADDFTAHVVATVNINSGSKINPKIKNLITANTTDVTVASADATFGNNSVYLAAGQVRLLTINKAVGAKNSLFISDAIRLAKVLDFRGYGITTANLKFASDVTRSFDLNNGQRDAIYDHAYISLKGGKNAPKGPLLVCVDYYSHGTGSGDGDGYFSVDSYPDATGDGYSDIPAYTSPKDGTYYELRDCLDFRPTRRNATNTATAIVLDETRIISPDETFSLDFSYYLPRIDRLVVTRNKEFKVIEGISAERPQLPSVRDDSMLLYTLTVPAYTFSAKDVGAAYQENKRYTMREIGAIEQRVKNLEYYSTLSLLEKEAQGKPVLDQDGLERTKYGTLVDSFTSTNVVDSVNDDCADTYSMDLKEGYLRPRYDETFVPMVYRGGESGIQRKGNLLMKKYSLDRLVNQPYASKAIAICDFLIARFEGNLELVPDTDIWYDITQAPDVVVNLNGDNDAWKAIAKVLEDVDSPNNPFGVEWNSWKTKSRGVKISKEKYFGEEYRTDESYKGSNTTFLIKQDKYLRTTYTDILKQTRTGIDTSLTTETITKQLGDRIVDMSIIPYIRPMAVQFVASQMRPTRQIYGYFDGVTVTKQIARANEIDVTWQNSERFDDILEGRGEDIHKGLNTAPVLLVSGNTVYFGCEYHYDNPDDPDTSNNTVFVKRGPTDNDLGFQGPAKDLADRTAEYYFPQNGVLKIFYNTYSAENTIYVYRGSTANVSTSGTPIFAANDDVILGASSPNDEEIEQYEGLGGSKYVGPLGVRGAIGKRDQRRMGVFRIRHEASENKDYYKVVVGKERGNNKDSPFEYAVMFTPRKELTNIGQTIRGKKTGVQATIVAQRHYHGNVVSATANTITFELDAKNTNNWYVGNTIYIVHGQGKNQSRNISSYNGATRIATVDSEWNELPSLSNSVYSIGTLKTDVNGYLPGTFYIPKSSGSRKFRTGSRVFRLIDDPSNDIDNATTFATREYYAQGMSQTVQSSSISTRVPKLVQSTTRENRTVEDGSRFEDTLIKSKTVGTYDVMRDPLAQTFYVDGKQYPDGIFLSRVIVYFKAKDATLPVTCEIRPVVNGYPSSSTILASKTLGPNKVTVTANPQSTETGTTFGFMEPVHLMPGEHCFVLLSDSKDYEVYVAELGKNIIGTSRRISEQPYLGSLFKSQNSSTWTAFQNEDMMFTLMMCTFETGSADAFLGNETPLKRRPMDTFELSVDSIEFEDTNIRYDFRARNHATGVMDTDYTRFFENEEYSVEPDSASYTNRKGITRSLDSMNVRVRLATSNPRISPIINLETLNLRVIDNIIDNGGIQTKDIVIIDGGSGYNTNVSVVISGGGGENANGFAVIDSNTGAIETIIIDNNGNGYYETPEITLLGGGPITDAVIAVSGETNSRGGNMSVRYITKKVQLKEGLNAGDIRLWLDIYRPVGTEVYVYYKVLNDLDPTAFDDRPYSRMMMVGNQNIRSTVPDQYMEYEFRPSTTIDKVTYAPVDIDTNEFNTFRYFAIKIVMQSQNQATIPKIKNLRATAVPTGVV